MQEVNASEIKNAAEIEKVVEEVCGTAGDTFMKSHDAAAPVYENGRLLTDRER